MGNWSYDRGTTPAGPKNGGNTPSATVGKIGDARSGNA